MKNNPKKAAVIGCGFVGAATAFTLMQSKLFSELVLLDANHDKAVGEAEDIGHGIPFAGEMDIYAGDYDDIADCSIIIVTAGANQKPNETRLDLVQKNVAIYKSIIPEIAKRNYEGILLIVSNPVDILTYVAQKLSGLPERRVIGSGTVLDTARLKYALSQHLNVDSRNIRLSSESTETVRLPLGAAPIFPVFRWMISWKCAVICIRIWINRKSQKRSRTVRMILLRRSMRRITALRCLSAAFVNALFGMRNLSCRFRQ